MTKSIRFTLHLFLVLSVFLPLYLQAQQCSREALTAKYWQYRDNLNKHFVLTDRRPEGCVGDGIHFIEGVHPFGETSTEHCGQRFLSGYSLPATSIDISPNGAFGGMEDRNKKFYDDGSPNPFHDPACADAGPSEGTNWDDDEIHNYLEMGEETPHQMQWYWTTLATEYALLIQQGQTTEAQRTLEELYLALQAYRRMDMLANCMAEERYVEITADFEVETCGDNHCLCGPKYVDSPGGFNDNFKTDTQDNCPFQADLSGYTGFSLREDGTQALEALNDFSEDKWNIDLVGGDYAMSSMPPCTTAISQACYNVKDKNFLSHDQMYALMSGLVMIKKFIPASATITTCDGTTENVLSIAQNIGKGLVDVADNDTKRINWPGAEDCCDKQVHISAAAGGYLNFTYAGLQMMYNNLSDTDDRKITKWDKLLFNEMGGATLGIPLVTTLNPHIEGKFFLEGVAFGMDIMDLPKRHIPTPLAAFVPIVPPRDRVISALDALNVEIYGLINNLLFPGGSNVPVIKSWFESMLCSAPCGGPCQKPNWYDEHREMEANLPPPDGPIIWPEFVCSNTPEWTGQRWEGLGGALDWDGYIEPRQFNGLDFMALYNIYMLSFPEEQTDYYNPNRPQDTPNGHFYGEDKIEGPTTLCPGDFGTYQLSTNYNGSTIQNIVWSASSNINVPTPNSHPTTVQSVLAKTPSWIEASLEELRSVPQYHNGEEVPPSIPYAFVPVEDACAFNYHKPIVSEVPNYWIKTDIDPCQLIYRAEAVIAVGLPEPPISEDDFIWTAVNNTNGWTTSGTGRVFYFGDVIPPPHHPCETVTIRLRVQNECENDLIKAKTIDCSPCPNGLPPQIVITPNPANNQVAINIMQNQSQDFISTDPNGVRIRIYPSSGGSAILMDSYLYSNGQYFNVGSLPNGIYQVTATASDLPPIQTNLSIVR